MTCAVRKFLDHISPKRHVPGRWIERIPDLFSGEVTAR
jgi:hypothetical protein